MAIYNINKELLVTVPTVMAWMGLKLQLGGIDGIRGFALAYKEIR
jgi:hypothetical protein